jgi:biopolymer transport protein ExbB
MQVKRTVGLLCLAVWLGMFSAGLYAQETAAPSAAGAAAAAAVVEEETSTTFIGLLKQGGILMWPLGLLSVATIALAAYGFVIVQERKMLTPELVPPIQEALDRLHLDEAVQLCTGTPSLLTNILHAGLQRISDGVLDVPSMDKAMEEAAVEESNAGLKTISYLSIIAQLAPMLGLLGTVSGMIKAFQKIGKGAMGKPEVLAGDIGEALVTTAAGLIIGIPAMFLYFYLKSRYTSNVSRIGRVVGNLSHRLIAASRRAETRPPTETVAAAAEPAAAEETASAAGGGPGGEG